MKVKQVKNNLKTENMKIFSTYILSLTIGKALSFFAIINFNIFILENLSKKIAPIILSLGLIPLSVIIFISIFLYSSTLLFKDLINIFNLKIEEDRYKIYKTFSFFILIFFILFPVFIIFF